MEKKKMTRKIYAKLLSMGGVWFSCDYMGFSCIGRTTKIQKSLYVSVMSESGTLHITKYDTVSNVKVLAFGKKNKKQK